MSYYVYICYVNNEPKYVGRGKGNRYKHCTSGVSSNYELNKAHFNGEEMSVRFVEKNLSRQSARELENETIENLGIDNLFNRRSEIDSRANTDWYKRFRPQIKRFFDTVVLPVSKGLVESKTEVKELFDSAGRDIPIRDWTLSNKKLLEFLGFVIYKGDDSKFYVRYEGMLDEREFISRIRGKLSS